MRKLLLVSVMVCMTMLLNAQTLKRGVAAVPGMDGGMFISWRLLDSDPAGGLYNVYRKNADGSVVKLNNEPVSGITNFIDKSADPAKENKYFVEAAQSDTNSHTVKQLPDISDDDFAVAAVPSEPYFSIPLRNGPEIHFCWVGDLDGDGENDYVVDRLDWGVGCRIEAYKSNGTFLWDVDYGPNSANMNNISPGSATIDVGHWDGVTVADVNGDGRAEVITKIANGVRLGNGEVWTHSDNNRQWIAVLDGATGARVRYAALPTDYLSVGPLACQFGVGNNNEIFVHAKNRNSNGSFNVVNVVYTMGSSLTQKWKRTGAIAEAHQFRIVDVNLDGVDDMAHIGYVLNGVNGTVLYTLPGIIHGDRFQIGKFDPNRPGLQGYGIQQNNQNGIVEYYYDATTGQILWTHVRTPYDNGRGNAADIDPRYPGYEVWSFEGVYNGPTNTQLTQEPNRPWPNFRLWWDGDNGSELYDNGKIEAWNYSTNSVQRLLTCSQYEGATGSARGAPLFYGDIWGDWREEVIMRNASNNRLIIFTTNIPTSISRPPLTQDRYYRNCLTLKGYMQSHYTSYYLGEGGSTCSPTQITPYVQVNGGSWQGTANITVNSGDEIRFGPQPVSGGSWSWTGCGTSGSSREQTISPSSSCTAIATYTNSCGSQSTQSFMITVNGGPSETYYQLQNRGTGLLLDGMGRTTNGDACGQYANTTHVNSHWEMVDVGSGYYQLQNRGTGLYLDGMGRTNNGADCGQYANTTHQNSHWSLQQYSGSYYRLQNRGTGLYLDGLGYTSNGDPVGQWANTTSQNAQWQIIPVASGSSSRVATAERLVTDEELISVLVHPNPANNEITIVLPSSYEGEKTASLINGLGNVTMSSTFNDRQHTMHIGNLSPGLYILRITSNNKLITEKVIKR